MAISKDTIIAPATHYGHAAIHLIRISGTHAINISQKFFKGKKRLCPENARQAIYGEISHPTDGVIDQVIITCFVEPHSFTGENMVEISCHGSPFIVDKIISLYLENGVRLAHPGEFTQRAFLNGKLDLSQAEAIGDLIYAENAISHKLALKQLKGNFSNLIDQFRQNIIHFASLLELELDFSEEDVEFANRKELISQLEDIIRQLHKIRESSKYKKWLQKGFPVAILGRPNAGKSTLLNALIKEERAIVTPIPGTTRDTIEETITLHDLTLRIIDTAGIRKTDDPVEKIGIDRSFQKAAEAFVILYLYDAAETSPEVAAQDLTTIRNINPEAVTLVIANKMDAINDDGKIPPEHFKISAQNEQDIDHLKELLYEKLKSLLPGSDDIYLVNQRQNEALQKAEDALQRAKTNLLSDISHEFVAMDLRESIHHLSLITGKISTDDLLENIFRNFCIGK